MADDDFEELDFDDGDDEQDDFEYEERPSARQQSSNARRELEKHLEMKRLREMLDSPEFDDDF